jgi:hypothetical protein
MLCYAMLGTNLIFAFALKPMQQGLDHILPGKGMAFLFAVYGASPHPNRYTLAGRCVASMRPTCSHVT